MISYFKVRNSNNPEVNGKYKRNATYISLINTKIFSNRLPELMADYNSNSYMQNSSTFIVVNRKLNRAELYANNKLAYTAPLDNDIGHSVSVYEDVVNFKFVPQEGFSGDIEIYIETDEDLALVENEPDLKPYLKTFKK